MLPCNLSLLGCMYFLLYLITVSSKDTFHDTSLERSLFSIFPAAGGNYSVDTVSSDVANPSGIEAGYFKGQYGFFVSSTSTYTISFINHASFKKSLVAGIPNTYGSHDAQLRSSLFASPTRMSYDFVNSRLYVAERRSGNIRIVDFHTEQTTTLKDSSTGGDVTLQYNVQGSSTYPGMDIQIGDNVLYAVDTVKLYAITAFEGTGLVGLPGGAVVTEYTSLAQYFAVKEYASSDSQIFVYSVAPDTNRSMLYVAVSYERNVILQVPMDSTEPYTSISVLLGDESSVYMGHANGSPPPALMNGNRFNEEGEESPSNVLLSFPIHARMSSDMSTFYFSEAYPASSSVSTLFGSLSIRRLVMAIGEVDSYAGVDQSQDNSTAYAFIGGEGGTTDGLVEEAEFVYPMSFAVLGEEGSGDSGSFDAMVVADHSSHSVRRVFAYMDTPAPSAAPSPGGGALGGIFSVGGMSVSLTVALLLSFFLLTAVLACGVFGACGERLRQTGHSSANVLTLMRYKILGDVSKRRSYVGMEDLSESSVEGPMWADIAPSGAGDAISLSDRSEASGRGNWFGRPWGSGGHSKKAETRAVMNVLDVSDSDSSCSNGV